MRSERVKFYEELLHTSVARALALRAAIKELLGDRPLGWQRLTPIERLQRLRELFETDERLLALSGQYDFDTLLRLIEEKEKLEANLAPKTAS